MKLTIPFDDGDAVEFECGEVASTGPIEEILRGRTYPDLSFVDDIATVVDVGAGSGAASLWFSRCRPTATVHAVEPDPALSGLLRTNVAALAHVEIHDALPAPGWAAAHGIDRIDVLKVAASGAESAVLESLADLLPTVKVVYIGYESRETARELERHLAASHDLFIGVMYLDQGECIYLRSDIADRSEATEHLRDQLAAGLQGG